MAKIVLHLVGPSERPSLSAPSEFQLAYDYNKGPIPIGEKKTKKKQEELAFQQLAQGESSLHTVEGHTTRPLSLAPPPQLPSLLETPRESNIGAPH